MNKIYASCVAIFLLGLVATALEKGSSDLFLRIYDYVVETFVVLRGLGVPVEIIVFILMILESAGILIPSEVIMPLGGFLAAQGLANFRLVVLAGGLGNLVGSYVAYYLGLKGLSRIAERKLEYILKSVEERGSIVTFLTRLTPGVRTYAPFALGAARVRMRDFLIYTLIGSLLRSLPLAYLGFFFGAHRREAIERLHRFTPLILAVLLDALLLAIYKEKTQTGKAIPAARATAKITDRRAMRSLNG